MAGLYPQDGAASEGFEPQGVRFWLTANREINRDNFTPPQDGHLTPFFSPLRQSVSKVLAQELQRKSNSGIV
jgi:hypothetical protein